MDYIHCGDADETFPEFIRRLYAGTSLQGLPGVMRRENGAIAFEGRAPNLLDMGKTPTPDYDAHFFALEESGFSQFAKAAEPFLPIETARGCWWGEKAHCIFCGLNRSGMEFRSKNVEDILEMLERLSTRYQTSRFYAIDNILDLNYVDDLFGSALRIRQEIPASL